MWTSFSSLTSFFLFRTIRESSHADLQAVIREPQAAKVATGGSGIVMGCVVEGEERNYVQMIGGEIWRTAMDSFTYYMT